VLVLSVVVLESLIRRVFLTSAARVLRHFLAKQYSHRLEFTSRDAEVTEHGSDREEAHEEV
jgi:hypothetical protein